DQDSSCWIRVAQGWAGKQWGSLVLPRVGQEVLVSFLEGDPDRPIVTGAVYNGDQTVPYALPAEQTKSTWKSQSSKGGGGFNEFRFEDKKDAEEIYLHAQKDYVREVGHNDTRTITADELLTVKGKRTVDVTGAEQHTNAAKFQHDVKGDYVLKIDGSLTIDATGGITIKSAAAIGVDAGTTLTSKGEASQTVETSGVLTLKGNLAKIN
ncbi:MAG: type VI secretion system tip protein VgrG, partial [Gemmatimonadales bacterium]|nr:type VI secretion system tip protein VgrG [Gemmatimonadales bacterium]